MLLLLLFLNLFFFFFLPLRKLRKILFYGNFEHMNAKFIMNVFCFPYVGFYASCTASHNLPDEVHGSATDYTFGKFVL